MGAGHDTPTADVGLEHQLRHGFRKVLTVALIAEALPGSGEEVGLVVDVYARVFTCMHLNLVLHEDDGVRVVIRDAIQGAGDHGDRTDGRLQQVARRGRKRRRVIGLRIGRRHGGRRGAAAGCGRHELESDPRRRLGRRDDRRHHHQSKSRTGTHAAPFEPVVRGALEARERTISTIAVQPSGVDLMLPELRSAVSSPPSFRDRG